MVYRSTFDNVLSAVHRLTLTYATTFQRPVFSWCHYRPYLPRTLYQLLQNRRLN
jgi:hypothetical protein